ncbi:hypothetical protein [Nocardia jiangxiensis]|uniref:hypothetical protein n=1 Tax=Nocardia jiangxiensis TaxID=282685 RepID=UPI0002EAC4FA|nr:hypothetical protein [Nocardia jiangxiensis]
MKLFYAFWSAEDQEWVGVCPDYPSMSWLHPIPSQALEGIKKLVADVEAGVA